MAQLTILEAHEAPGRGPAGLAWDGACLWNADYVTGQIYRLDLATWTVQDQIICPGVLSGVAWDGHGLWQALIDEGWLRNINPASHDYDRTIVIADHGRLAGVTWDGRQLWAVSQQQGALLAIDREQGVVTGRVDIPVAAGGLAYRAGHLWVGYPYPMAFAGGQFDWLAEEHHFAVAEIDPGPGREVARYEVDFLPMGLAWVGDDLWLSSAARRQIYRARLP